LLKGICLDALGANVAEAGLAEHLQRRLLAPEGPETGASPRVNRNRKAHRYQEAKSAPLGVVERFRRRA
jgi:hypothetical protein